MDSEDALKEQFAKDKNDLIAEWKNKLKQAADEAKRAEQEKAAQQLKEQKARHDDEVDQLERKIIELQKTIQDRDSELNKKELIIQGKMEDIAQRDGTIRDLQAEIDRLKQEALLGN